MAEALVSYGSNVDPVENIPAALRALGEAVEITGISRAWETPPVGTTGPAFVNGAVRIETDGDREALRRMLRSVEDRLGRRRSEDRNAPRPIDLDLVYLGGEMVEDPAERAFVLVPVAEVAPELCHAPSGSTLKALAERADRSGFRPRPDIDELITK